MANRIAISLLCLAALNAVGCRVAETPTRQELTRDRKEARAQRNGPRPKSLPISNDAQRVLDACGKPQSDEVVSLHDKLHNGPTRYMTYQGRQPVTIEYIPYLLDLDGELVPWSGDLSVAMRPGTVWRFQSAHMESREFLTSNHFQIYLPCAARALSDEL